MKKHLKLTALAAVAAAGLIANPAWSQSSTSGTAGSMATGSGITAPNNAAGVNGDTRGDQLRTDCFDRTTRTWRSTSECAALYGSGALTGGNSPAIGGSPSIVGSGSGTAGAGASASSGVLGNSGALGATDTTGTTASGVSTGRK